LPMSAIPAGSKVVLCAGHPVKALVFLWHVKRKSYMTRSESMNYSTVELYHYRPPFPRDWF